VDPASVWCYLYFAGRVGMLVADGNGCGLGQSSLFCFCCSCCRHGDSPFEVYCFPRGRKLGSARSPSRAGRC
jgi:hypothetical protein